MIIKEKIGIDFENDTIYQFNFDDRMVILSNEQDNVIAMSFIEWQKLIAKWVEAYMKDLGE